MLIEQLVFLVCIPDVSSVRQHLTLYCRWRSWTSPTWSYP